MRVRSTVVAACVTTIFLVFIEAARAAGADATAEMVEREKHLQHLVDAQKARLSIQDTVSVSIVPVNKLVVSVERAKNGSPGFTLSVKDGFIQRLSDEEVGAVVAHELGHVWIYTHHPYLQTEELANEIALRIVSRELLESLYDKVWAKIGTKGTLTYLPVKPVK
jgi:hypothetical protein